MFCSGQHDAGLVADLSVQVEGLPPVDERVVVLALQEEDVADVVVALGELLLVAQLPPDTQRLLVGLPCLGVLAAPLVEGAEVVPHVGDARPVADALVDLASGP